MSFQLQMILIIAVLLYFIIIFKLLKNNALSLKYSLLWLFAGLIMGILVIFPGSLMFLVKITGIQTPMYALIVMCLAFVIAILLSMTSIVSRQNRKIRVMIQQMAILEKKIRDIESNE